MSLQKLIEKLKVEVDPEEKYSEHASIRVPVNDILAICEAAEVMMVELEKYSKYRVSDSVSGVFGSGAYNVLIKADKIAGGQDGSDNY